MRCIWARNLCSCHGKETQKLYRFLPQHSAIKAATTVYPVDLPLCSLMEALIRLHLFCTNISMLSKMIDHAILKKARAVAAESDHPLFTYFHIIPSRRRYRCIKCKTARCSRSFVILLPISLLFVRLHVEFVFCDNLFLTYF